MQCLAICNTMYSRTELSNIHHGVNTKNQLHIMFSSSLTNNNTIKTKNMAHVNKLLCMAVILSQFVNAD